MKSPGTVLAAAILACGAAWSAQAQAQPASTAAANTPESVRMAARTDRRGLVEKNMQLTEKEAARFWPIYDEYQKDLEKILRRQSRALTDYINAEASMTDANAKRIARELLSADADELRLREKLARKLSGALPAKKAVRFLQVENKIRTLQRYDIAEQMPLVR